MFTADFAEDFSGLTSYQILNLEKKGILKPRRQGGVKYYRYGDIYILRIVFILRRCKIKLSKIDAAYDYLKNLEPETPLTSHLLFHDGKEVYALLDQKQVKASKYGQMILEDTIQLFAVGSELEALRLSMNSYVKRLKRRAKKRKKTKVKTYTPDDLKQLLA